MHPKRTTANPMPTVDESWWESVLAEEGNRGGQMPGRSRGRVDGRGPARANEVTRPAPNWSRVKDLYSRDQIVSLRVTACNRGGLLVEGDELYGFVPFSHLVDIATQTEPADRAKSMEAYVGRTLRLK